MAKSFFDTLSAEEKRRIKERTDILVELLGKWTRRYSSIRTTRIPSVALFTATVAPGIPPPDSLPTMKLAFWVFGVDDIADERLVSLAALQQKVEQWHLIAHDGSTSEADDSDELSTMLLEIREDLSKFRLFEPLREYWSFEVRRLVEAMVQEYQHGLQYSTDGARALPSLDEYLGWGVYSISVPFWVLTVLIVLSDSSVEECLELIKEAAKHAGAAVRLYNDLRTFDKEIRENNINSVVIVYHAMLNENPGATEEETLSEAKRYILQLADSYGRKCNDLVRQIQTGSGQIEEAISRVVAFHAYFYGRSEHDYNITSLAEIHKLL